MLEKTENYRLIVKTNNQIQTIIGSGFKIERIYRSLVKSGVNEYSIAIVWL